MHPLIQCRVAKGLSNYVVFEHSKQDPKIAAHAHRTSSFADDEDGNLIAVETANVKAPTKLK